MTVSLIVCTRNRGARLPDFFASLLRLQAPDGGWELVLVDNASSDDTPARIAAFAAAAPFPVRAVRAPLPGLGRARNVGLAHASGNLFVFTDDDCYPAPDFLRAYVEVFARHPIGYAGGRIVLHDPTDARLAVRDLQEPMDILPHRFISSGLIHGANMAVRREVVAAIGGFDPLLGAGTPCISGEDSEFIARAAMAGWAGRNDPAPLVAHHHGRKPGPDEVRQRRGYECGRGAYHAKLLLDPRARGTYARGWLRRVRRRGLSPGAVGTLVRELRGAARYVVRHLLRPEPVPRLDTGDRHRAAVDHWTPSDSEA